MEQVLKHLLEDKQQAEKEERQTWQILIKDNAFKQAVQSESFKKWFLSYMQYAKIDPNSSVIRWRKALEKVQTLENMIGQVEEKHTQWKIFEKIKKI